MRQGVWARMVVLFVVVLFTSAPVPYTAPAGDLDGDGEVDIVDLQCGVRLYYALTLAEQQGGDVCVQDADCVLWLEQTHCREGMPGTLTCIPDCVADTVSIGPDPEVQCTDPGANDADCLGTSQKNSADMNCDGTLGNVDLDFMVAIILGKVGGPGTADYDSDGQLNFCDEDSDGDADPDETDCQPLNESVNGASPETLNLVDDDCDGLVDEDFIQPGMVVISEINQNPGCVADAAGEWIELYNAADFAIDVNGWALSDLEEDFHKMQAGGPLVVQPGTYLLLARNGNPEENGGISPDYVYSNFLLVNSLDSVILTMDGLVVDEVHYDGGPEFPDPDGASMNLSVDALTVALNDVGSSWCTATAEEIPCGDLGSPGGPNPLCDEDLDGFSIPGGDCNDQAQLVNPDADELCNGIDDNCNGAVDEPFPTLGEKCDGVDLDLCQYGTWTCKPDGSGVECVNEDPAEVVDICDGQDNDCDGSADEDFPTLGDICDGQDSDMCENGTWTCKADGSGVECVNEDPAGIPDICDGLDNDCNGVADQDYPLLGEACDGADSDFCEFGTYTCKGNGTGVECVNEYPAGVVEACNGQDDDCDGAIDEDFPNLGQPCDGDDTDQCKNGTWTCAGSGAFSVCVNETVTDIVEVCDQLDNDCDGSVDEDWVCCLEVGQQCGADGQCCSDVCNVNCCNDSCPADQWVCNGSQRQLEDHYCDALGSCASQTAQTQECGASGVSGTFQCSGQVLQQEYITRGCSGGDCFATPSWQDDATCQGTCGSWCNQGASQCSNAPADTQNASDCAQDGWFCSGNNREYRDYKCDGSGGCTYAVTQTENGGAPCTVQGTFGPCVDGQIQCSNGVLECAQVVFPATEVCDSLDNDCDGQTDEGNVCCLELGDDCNANGDCCSSICNVNCCQAACQGDAWACNGQIREYRDYFCGTLGQCTYSVTDTTDCGTSAYTNSYQCSGQTLQRLYEQKGCTGAACFVTPTWDTVTVCGQTCSSWCNSGQTSCGNAPSGTQTASGCTSDGWYCNGINREYRDYSCNGSGGCTYSVTQTQNGGSACSVSGKQGLCATGQQQCQGGTLVCVQTVFPATEICDAQDNDCDGSTDEGSVCGPEYLYYANMGSSDYSVCTGLSGKWGANYKCWTKGNKLSYTNMGSSDYSVCTGLGGKWGANYKCWFKGTTGTSGSSYQGSLKSGGSSYYDNSPASMGSSDYSVCTGLGGSWGSGYKCYYTSGKFYYANMGSSDYSVCTGLSGKWGANYKCWTKNIILTYSNMGSSDYSVCTGLSGKWGANYKCWKNADNLYYANMGSSDYSICTGLGGKWGANYKCWHNI